MPPHKTLWRLEPHTEGKHLVLRHYLDGWIPKLGLSSNRILFIDGFAGPGEYDKGEVGSPIIALNALREHRAKIAIRAEVVFLFIEKDEARADYLRNLLKEQDLSPPPIVRRQVLTSAFEDALTEVLNNVEEQRRRLAPAFVMIDPFGVSDTPMSIMERILQNPKSEVYVSFMYDFIRRFIESPEFEPHLDSLFGTDRWREARKIDDFHRKKRFLQGLYANQLKKAGARYVVHFELYEGNRHVYSIFFGTNNLDACNLMKQAIWKVAPFGDYQFRGARSGQLAFEDTLVDLSILESELLNQFDGEDAVRIEQLEGFVKSDETDFHSGHLKRKTLKPMEDAGRLEVVSSPRKKRGSFPNGTVVRFVP